MGNDSTCIDTYTEIVEIEEFQFPCEAAFDFWPTWQNPMKIHFHDLSQFQPGTWYWEFGDGETSTEPSPFHLYTEGGEYEVTLSIMGADSTCNESVTELVYVEEVVFGCEAYFEYFHTGFNPMMVHFWDMSDFLPGTWYWEFGDGETSGEPNPFHEYTAAGEYEVSLTIMGNDSTCIDTYTEIVEIEEFQFPCEAAFDFWPTWQNPMKIHFHDLSQFQPGTWYWEFGDGETSTEPSPFHLYTEGGEYEVTLTIMGADSTCNESVTELVYVEEVVFGCEAYFEYFHTGFNPMMVHFWDMSDFQPGTWFWEFGDGETSGEPNPFHEYTAAGEYDVSLTIMGNDSTCIDTYTEIVEIEEFQFPCEAAFDYWPTWQNPMEIHFLDLSQFQPGTWYWEFGDGETSNEPSPFHLYTEGGEYEVTLTIMGADSTCNESVTEIVYVEEVVFGCEAYFEYFHTGFNPMMVHFWDMSDFQPGTWYWEFGDGETSGEPNPFHEYLAGGEYEVSLTIMGNDSTCIDTYTEIVEIEEFQFPCEAAFDYWPTWQNPMEIHFLDLSQFQPGTWYWEFGDGETSNEPSPFHIYAEGGEYEVTLTIMGADSTCNESVTEIVYVEEVVFGCEAYFEYFHTGFNPMMVHFWDMSDFQPGTWYWEFGDGETSNEPNPFHEYLAGGEYEVSLTIFGADSSCVDTYSEIVVLDTLINACQSNFWWHHNWGGGNPLEIMFENNSYANTPIIEFAWDFGDGTGSDEENPVHLFSDFGFYDVTLGIVAEDGCESEATFEVWVHDWQQNCQALFVPYIDSINPLQVYFNDMSIGPITEWFWEFGDGETSFEQNPVHTYATQDVYIATLTIEAENCTSSFYYEIDLITGQVVVSPGPTTGIIEQETIEVSLYPNPVQNILNIDLNTNSNIEVQIVNLAGQVIITSRETSIDVSNLSQGIYFANIVTNGQVFTRKFIK